METIAVVNQSDLDQITDAIQTKTKANKTYKTNQIAQAIHDLSSAELKITASCVPGAVVAVQSSDGTYSETKTAETTELIFHVPKDGTYIVSSTVGGNTTTHEVNVKNTFEAKLYDLILSNNSWSAIRDCCDAGLASSYWAVGDTKSIIINGTVGATTFSNLAIDVYIIGFNHNSSVEGSNRIHFKLGMINNVQVALCDSSYDSNTTTTGKFTMNTSQTNNGGWNASHMRKTVLGSNSSPASPTANTLLSALPADLRSVMKSVVKYSDNTGGGLNTASYVTATTDYLPLLAEFEVQGSCAYANSAEQNYQQQYAYYTNGNSKVHYKHNGTSTACYVWLRSVYCDRYNTSNNFCAVATDGGANLASAYCSLGVSPAFVV